MVASLEKVYYLILVGIVEKHTLRHKVGNHCVSA
jgi:hypothetical protein